MRSGLRPFVTARPPSPSSSDSSDTELDIRKPRWPSRLANTALQVKTKTNVDDAHTMSITGSTKPIKFDTFALTPKTHKTTHGILTILPTGSLLVDFRESQRRQKRKGTEVLLISPDGRKVRREEFATHRHLNIFLVDRSVRCSTSQYSVLLNSSKAFVRLGGPAH